MLPESTMQPRGKGFGTAIDYTVTVPILGVRIECFILENQVTGVCAVIYDKYAFYRNRGGSATIVRWCLRKQKENCKARITERMRFIISPLPSTVKFTRNSQLILILRC